VSAAPSPQKGASIGFVPRELSYSRERGGFDFAKAELLEWSLLSVPAAARCP